MDIDPIIARTADDPDTPWWAADAVRRFFRKLSPVDDQRPWTEASVDRFFARLSTLAPLIITQPRAPAVEEVVTLAEGFSGFNWD